MHLVFILFIIIASIQLCYFTLIFSRLPLIKYQQQKASSLPVSVLICARNESKNLEQFLPNFIAQDYTNYELVLINDGSYDNTLEIFEQFQEKHKSTHQIKIVDVVENERFWGNKKYALTLGIKAASNEYLLFTDADCKPVSNNWIGEIASKFSDTKQIILGYGAHHRIKNSLFNKLLRFETLYTALQYISYANIGLPYMGVGRNLAYTKSLFFKSNGFAKHMHIKSGDDDLFVNQIATRNNTAVTISPESFTSSIPKSTFRNWINQKRRHISTANHYRPIHKFLLGLSYSSQLLFLFLATTLLLINYQLTWVLLIIGFKMLLQYIIIGISAKKLNEKDIIFWIPFFEIFLILIQLFIFIKNKISKPTHW